MAAAPSDPEELQHHVSGLRRLARAVLRDDAAAEDVAQQTVVRALERPESARMQWPWLARVARNLAIDRLRSDRRRAAREERHARGADAAEDAPADRVARAEAHRDAMDALLALPDPYRSALIMRFLEDRPAKDIARELGVAEATVRSHHKRGLAMIRERLEQRHGDDWRARLALLLPPAAAPTPAAPSAPPWATVALAAAMAAVAAAHALWWTPAPAAAGADEPPGIYDGYVRQMLQQLGYSDVADDDGR